MKLDEAIEALESGRVVPAGERALCAVSGGADSVALLAIMSGAAGKAGYELCAAHVHHGIRAASDEELEFVSALCRRLNVPLYTLRADVPAIAKASGESIESAARRVRYDFFYSTAREHGCGLIALAHHSRDQAETVLMHVLRGSAVSGLCAMRPRAGMLIRPLLNVDPEELREYLAQRGLDFREDATNADIRYTRNYVRHVILPACERAYPGSRSGLCRLAAAASLDEEYLENVASGAAQNCICEYSGGIYIRTQPFAEQHRAIQARLAARAMRMAGQDAEYAGIQRIIGTLDGAEATLSGGVRVSRGAARIYLEYPDRQKSAAVLPLEVSETWNVELSGGSVCAAPIAGAELGNGRTVQVFDAEKLKGAVLRTERAGDEIYPLGAPGRKKLRDYYIDHKVDRQVRDYLPVLALDNRILWALGVGVARDAAVTDGTAHRIKLCWNGRGLW